jgi:DNA-binding GntR family transcriptional regulator
MTLRQALALLEREGRISRRHGLGTFVASPSID